MLLLNATPSPSAQPAPSTPPCQPPSRDNGSPPAQAPETPAVLSPPAPTVLGYQFTGRACAHDEPTAAPAPGPDTAMAEISVIVVGPARDPRGATRPPFRIAVVTGRPPFPHGAGPATDP